jgi:hypothetical protein
MKISKIKGTVSRVLEGVFTIPVHIRDVSKVPLDAFNFLKRCFPLQFLKISELAWRHFNITTQMKKYLAKLAC